MTAVAANNDLDRAEARRQRAETGEFEFYVSAGHIICTNVANQKSYRVTASGTCDCPDATYRKVVCKHATALRLHLMNTGGVV
jgi:uncharacterized Zn finger protein